jgi:hypothetical protein
MDGALGIILYPYDLKISSLDNDIDTMINKGITYAKMQRRIKNKCIGKV